MKHRECQVGDHVVIIGTTSSRHPDRAGVIVAKLPGIYVQVRTSNDQKLRRVPCNRLRLMSEAAEALGGGA